MWMRPIPKGPFFLALAMTGCLQAAFAYELETHDNITNHAVSQLEIDDYLSKELNISTGTSFGGKSPSRWMRDGSKDEDNNFVNGPVRVRNHFYNPLTEGGYAYIPVPNYPAPTWALEDLGDVAGQEFSLKDARQYLYEGLTNMSRDSREQKLAKTFYALGHVVHLIQDMAQPQHTRDDSHLLPALLDSVHFLGASARVGLYEQYTEDNRTTPVYDGYPAVYRAEDPDTFNAPRDYWHRVGGKGLADFSNREFVTGETIDGTNFHAVQNAQPLLDYTILPHEGLPYPNGQEATVATTTIVQLLAEEGGTNLEGEIDFVLTPVDDAYTGEHKPDQRTSSYSIFDPELQHDGQPLTFTVNRFVFRDAWASLIPRAVGYSAGFINYFFRGRIDLDADPDPDDADGYVIKNKGPEDMSGRFELYYDDANKRRQQVPDGSWDLAIAQNDQAAIGPIMLPDPPPPDGKYTLVFHGTMGSEIGAVAAKVVDLSIVFVDLGTDPPPTALGPVTVTPFDLGAQAALDDETFVASIPGSPHGTVSVAPALEKLTAPVPDSWETWSHGYAGPVFSFPGHAFDDRSRDVVTITLPAGTRAFSFYAEPNLFEDFIIRATADDGTTSGGITVQGFAGANGYGFYSINGHIKTVTVESDPNARGFALGEFSIAVHGSS